MRPKYKVQKRRREASTLNSSRRGLKAWVRNLHSGGRLLRLDPDVTNSTIPATKSHDKPSTLNDVPTRSDATFPDTTTGPREFPSMSSIEEALPSEVPSNDQSGMDSLPPLDHRMPSYIINMLHHSAGNSEVGSHIDPTALHVEMRYPSNYTERFVLSHRVHRGSQKDRSLEPIDDLIRTIEVILHLMTGPIGPHTRLCPILRRAWETHDIPLFQETMRTLTHHLSSPLRITRLSPSLIHHFFAQLYDRSVSPHAKGLDSRRDPKTTNSVYGELQPAFLSRIFKQVNLTKECTYLDLGSGVGNTAMQAALETGCEAHGIEREPYAHLVSALHLQQFHIRARLWDLRPGQVSLYQGDFLLSDRIASMLEDVDVVVVNNLKFEPETDVRLYELLKRKLKVGARVASTKPVVVGKLRSPGKGNGGVVGGEVFEVESCVYGEDSVSWTSSEGVYYVSRKVGRG